MSEIPISISIVTLPEDAGWKSTDETPAELRRIITLYQGALCDEVDGRTEEIDDIDQFYHVYDAIYGQSVVVARDEDEKVVGVASYDMQRKIPFFEGVAVAPYHRSKGIASKLVSYILHTAADQGASVMHCRSQPSSVNANTHILQKSGYNFNIDENDTYPLITVHLQ